ncbi:hypothetical protein [Allobaculum sp. JKK-2023]|uniref:hypothetical protein n=1 Tax=Allobaculum sp. JKK-2023 TaxID=3108943 RepID=UPI002B05C14A|nr:hypothetical protein [Allobaculum sp. JKK-2023]
MKYNKILAVSLATVLSLTNAASLRAVETTFAVETNEENTFDTKVWPAIQQNTSLTYTVHKLRADGRFSGTTETRTFATATAVLNDVLTSQTSGKKYYLVSVTPNVDSDEYIYLVPGYGYLPGEGADKTQVKPDPSFQFRFVEDSNGNITKDFDSTTDVLTNMNGENQAGLVTGKEGEFVVGPLPTKLEHLTVRCQSNTTGKNYDVSLSDCPVNNVSDPCTTFFYWQGHSPTEGMGCGKSFRGEIELRSVLEKLKNLVGKDVKLTDIGSQAITKKESQSIEAAISIGYIIQNNVLPGSFIGNDQEEETYRFGGENTWDVLYFDEFTSPSGSDSGSTSTSKPTKPADPQKPSDDHTPVASYRLYNPNTGEHFYTTNRAEHDILKNSGWNSESGNWKLPMKSEYPIYRLYNPNSGDHHYTLSQGEKNVLIGFGWKDEGIGMYSATNDGEVIYRLYNPNAKVGQHHYTNNKAEKDMLVKVGWHDEGTAWYGLK